MSTPLFYTLDLETDPFEHGRRVQPFAACIYDGEQHRHTWGENCVAQMVDVMRELPPGIVYAHNGGRFDFFWFLKYASQQKKMVIIKNRIVKFELETGHDMRDSFKLFPFALAQYKKTDIDYEKFRPEVREIHRQEIQSYLGDDCTDLYELIQAYFERFGPALTIGSTAFKELKGRYDVGPVLSQAWDKHIRENYYFGGRVERYKIGVFDGNFKVFDINSAYPKAMRDYRHPIGQPAFGRSITSNTFFIQCAGRNFGALAARTKMGLRFDLEEGIFRTTIHEFSAAVETGRFQCSRILQTIEFEQSLTFEEYINHFYGLRIEAGEKGDKIHKLMYKFLLNNSYGKFAINPENYKDYQILNDWEPMDICQCRQKCKCGKWQMVLAMPEVRLIMYARPTRQVHRMNIATGASITGATRSMLMRGLAAARGAMYCDTDSVIAEDMPGMPMSETELGAWKCEGEGDRLAIAGRKMYALFKGGECIKSASKGVNLNPEQIVSVARGELITYNQAAPVFRLDGSIDFLSRDVRAT